ncbi:MAG TPA: MFS transporter [Caulobacteraceae bacterium]|nr:MFS transporter [Caulobacteraceae bacterium]
MAVLLVVVFVNLAGFGVLLPILPFYARAFHAPVWLVTWVFTAFSLGNFFAEPTWGRLSDKIGRRPILLGTITASGLGFIALAFAPSIWAVLLIRLAMGLATGNLSTIQGYIADITPAQHRAGRIGLLGAAFALGFVAGPALGGFLARPELGLAGYRVPLLAAGGLALTAAGGAFLFLRESCARAKISTAGVSIGVFQRAMRHPVLARALVVTLLYTAAFAAAESTFGLWTQRRYGWGPEKLSICLACVAVAAAVAQGFLTGRITRRFGEAATLAGGLVLISLTLAAQPLGQGMPRTVVLLALTIFGQALALPNIIALISRATPSDCQGTMLGLNTAVGALARAAGPIAGGALFSIVGADAPLYVAALLVAPAILLAWQAEGQARRSRGAPVSPVVLRLHPVDAAK